MSCDVSEFVGKGTESIRWQQVALCGTIKKFKATENQTLRDSIKLNAWDIYRFGTYTHRFVLIVSWFL